jgi:branched-chain amino acid aminotransferase
MDGAIVWRDGSVTSAQDATVSMLDAGILYGDGLFETMRAAGARVEFLDEHVARMERSAAALFLSLPPTEELAAGVCAAVAAADFELASVRLTVTRGLVQGIGPRGAAAATKPSWWVMVTPVEPGPPKPARAVLLDPALVPPRPEHKSLSWQHAVVAQIAAGDADGIYVDESGEITEGISSNVFAVYGSVLHTPPAERALPGVTRAAVLDRAPEAGLEPLEAPLTVEHFRAADEIMLSGAVAHVRAVVELDGVAVGNGAPGPAHARLLAALQTSS